LTGLGVTAVLQSSTATGLMISAFAAAGVVSLASALAVMLGANVGTTLIVQVLSFDVSPFSPLLILAGVGMFRAGSAQARDLGRAAIGLGLMLLALSRLLQIITPYEDMPSLRILMGGIATDTIISTLFGALMAWAAHSSVAVVLLVMSLAAKGVIPFHAAMALIVGANIGTALNPLLEGTRSGEMAGRRVAIGNLVFRLAGAAVVLPLAGWIGPHLLATEPNLSRAAADFHTAFNLFVALAFLPLLFPFALALEKLFPDRLEAADPSRPMYLDQSAIEIPSVALGHAAREVLRMVDVLDEMLTAVSDAMRNRDRETLSRVRRTDDVLDALNREIKSYVTSIDPDNLTDEEHHRLEAILAFAFNLESAGDVVERNIAGFLAKQIKRGAAMSNAGRAEVEQSLDAVRSNLRTAASIFTTGDERAARVLAEQKEQFRNREAAALKAHIGLLRAGGAAVDAPPVDLLRDIKRLNDHLVAGAAYPVLEARGYLASSRMLPEGG
jgi:phosphate:Na+ symporter